MEHGFYANNDLEMVGFPHLCHVSLPYRYWSETGKTPEGPSLAIGWGPPACISIDHLKKIPMDVDGSRIQYQIHHMNIKSLGGGFPQQLCLAGAS